MDTDFAQMPSPPPRAVTAQSVLATMLHAAAFRYHWATANLPAESLPFQPCPGSMTMQELLHHMHRLAWWLEVTLSSAESSPTPEKVDAASFDAPAARAATEAALAGAAAAVETTSAEALAETKVRRGEARPELPFWSVLHGPLADFLTHVGQVTSWRRMFGAPAPVPRYAEGLAPVEGGTLELNESMVRQPMEIRDQDLSDARFHDVALTGADFNDVSLAGAKFTNVTFAGATLTDVDLSNVNITDANIEGLRIDGELISK